MVTVHTRLATHMAVENLVVIDYRISIPYAFAPIPNSVPPMIAKVVSIAGR
jgi:hypothetical protein